MQRSAQRLEPLPDGRDQLNAASLRLARLAKLAGVKRFLVSSSCGIYGAADDAPVNENAPLHPLTVYGRCKVKLDSQIASLAGPDFSPTFLRNATAYGASPRLRLDVVLNNLVASAWTTGRIVMQSDGTPWRPIVHVEDICRAFLAVLKADRDRIHNQSFNVGVDSENCQVRDLARMVAGAVPGCPIEFAPGAAPDKRTCRVDFSKIRDRLPEFRPQWPAGRGAAELYGAFRRWGLTAADFDGPRFKRLARIKELLEAGLVDHGLLWTSRKRKAPAFSVSAPASFN